MNKLRIAILVDQLIPGGVQKAALEEAVWLKKNGFDVTLLVLIRTVNKVYPGLPKNLNIIFLSDFNPPLFKKAHKIPYFSFLTNLHIFNPYFVDRYKCLKKIDYIISHGTTTSITATAISKKFGIPFLVFIWDPMRYILEKVYQKKPLIYFFPILRMVINHYEKSIIRSAHMVATGSKVHQDYLRNTYDINPEVIYPGCDPQTDIPRKKGKYILGLSRWELVKNPQLFIWLAKQLPDQKFLLAGSWNNPDEEKHFHEMISSAGIQNRLQLFSPVASLKELSSKSLVWVHPHFEAFGMGGLEMASLGLPMIIPKGSGVTELFEEFKHGFFPVENSRKQFLKYIKILISNPKKAQEMGRKAAAVTQNLTWQNHTQHILKLISRKKLLILEISHAKGSSLAGGDRLMEPMASHLTDMFDFSIITTKIGFKHWQKAPFPKEIEYLPPNFLDNNVTPQAMFFNYCIRILQSIHVLKKYKTDFLYSSNDIIADILPFYLMKQKNPDVFWIARIHHLLPHPLKREGNFFVNTVSYLMQQLSLVLIKKRADLILLLNQDVKNKLLKRGFEKNKLKILGAGINIENIKKQEILSNTLIFDGIFLGRLHRTKGVFDLIQIWSNIVQDKPSAKLAIIGSGDKQITGLLKKEIVKKGLAGNIKLMGFLPDPKVISVMKKAKVFLFTDHEAGFGLAVAEAMACGLPVVGYDIGVLGNVYKKGFIKIPLLDYHGFSQSVIKILTNTSLQKKLSEEASSQAINFDWKDTADLFRQFITHG